MIKIERHVVFLVVLCAMIVLAFARVVVLCCDNHSFFSNNGNTEQHFNSQKLQVIAKEIAQKEYVHQIVLIQFENRLLVGLELEDIFDEDELKPELDIFDILERNALKLNDLDVNIICSESVSDIIELSNYLDKKVPKELLIQRFNSLHEMR